MKISVVYVHPLQPRVIIHTPFDGYVLVQSRFRTDMSSGDIISGDPLLTNVKWFLNVTRGLLIDVRVLGRYPSLASAKMAASPQHTPEALRKFRPFTRPAETAVTINPAA